MALTVNQVERHLSVPPTERLLTTLRARLGLTGAKEACGVGECGACTVLIDGQPQLACLTLTSTVTAAVTTVEGMAEESCTLREAFADEGGFQCGFCTPGQLVAAKALLARTGPEDLDQQAVRHAMVGNLCRCTGYLGIVRAILREHAKGTDLA